MSSLAPEEPGPARRPDRRRRGDRLAHLFPDLPGGRYAVAGFAVATALIGGAFVAGGESEDTPVVEPRLADYAVEHAVTSRHVPVIEASDSAASEAGHGATEADR